MQISSQDTPQRLTVQSYTFEGLVVGKLDVGEEAIVVRKGWSHSTT
jgi:hypothetical protein